LIVQAIPLCGGPKGGIDAMLLAAPTALVVVVDPDAEESRSPAEALRLLGLTPAEARVAALIGGGHSRSEAAETLGISEWTAREALKRVYSKLDIARQSELVRLVHRLAVFSDPSAY
jgi:DNA-binding CsgD family transcriptional regulator